MNRLATLAIAACLLMSHVANAQSVASPERQRELLKQINSRVRRPEVRGKLKDQKAGEKARLDEFVAKRQADRAAARPFIEAARKKAAEAEARAYQAQQAEQRAMLPIMMEAQRQQLERISAMERNMMLARIAAANERSANTAQQMLNNQVMRGLGYGPGFMSGIYNPSLGGIEQSQRLLPQNNYIIDPTASMPRW